MSMHKQIIMLAFCAAFTLPSHAAGDFITPASSALPSEGLLLIDENPATQIRTVRVRFDANAVLDPHPFVGADYFLATVIDGSIRLGVGNVFDESTLVELMPGSVFSHDTQTGQHYGIVGPEGMVLQVTMKASAAPTQAH